MASITNTAVPAIFKFHGHEVRIVMKDGEPWFVATDVCAALGYANPSKAIADHLDDDERSNEQLDRTRMGSKALIINESGLYALVLRSRKPEARKFAKWVTGEVLPTIRKTGSYAENGANHGADRQDGVCYAPIGEFKASALDGIGFYIYLEHTAQNTLRPHVTAFQPGSMAMNPKSIAAWEEAFNDDFIPDAMLPEILRIVAKRWMAVK